MSPFQLNPFKDKKILETEINRCFLDIDQQIKNDIQALTTEQSNVDQEITDLTLEVARHRLFDKSSERLGLAKKTVDLFRQFASEEKNKVQNLQNELKIWTREAEQIEANIERLKNEPIGKAQSSFGKLVGDFGNAAAQNLPRRRGVQPSSTPTTLEEWEKTLKK